MDVSNTNSSGNGLSNGTRVKRVVIVLGGGAAIMLGVLGFADRPTPTSPAELIPVAQGEATTTTVLPSVNYVPSAAPSVKATFFGKS